MSLCHYFAFICSPPKTFSSCFSPTPTLTKQRLYPLACMCAFRGRKIVLNNATNEKDFFNFSSLRLPSNAGKCSMLSEGKKSWFSPSLLTLHTTRSAKIPFFGDFCPRVATEKRGKEKTFSSNKSNLYKTKFLLAALKYWTGKPAALIRFVRKLAGD
jgi:hypothetical protein